MGVLRGGITAAIPGQGMVCDTILRSNDGRQPSVCRSPVPEATYRKFQHFLEDECTTNTVKDYITKLKDATKGKP